MGSTPRPHRYAIPMATRSTDVATIAQCPGRFMLQNFYESDQQEATYFELGSALHEGIEVTIKEDLDLDQALVLVTGRIEDWLTGLEGQPLESSKRGVDTILDDADRMMRSWFKWVHPDSDKRHEIYDAHHWPPRVEMPFNRTDSRLSYPVWGSIDAVFTAKTETPGAFAICDWKSGSSRQRDSDQLHFYQFGSDLDIGRAWFHHLDRKQKRSVIQEADDYPGDDVIVRRIKATEDMKELMLDRGTVKFEPGWQCNYCVVRKYCPQEGTDRKGNLTTLQRMVSLARPMTTIERAA